MADKTTEEILKETQETAQILKESFNSLGATIRTQLNANLTGADAATKQLIKKVKFDLSSAINGLGKSSEKLLENQLKLNKGQLSTKDLAKQMLDLEYKGLKIANDLSTAKNNGLILDSEAVKMLNDIEEKMKEESDELTKQLTISQAIEKSMGNLGGVVKGLSKIPIVGQFIKADDVLGKMQETAAKTKSTIAVLGTGFKEIGKNIVSGISDPLTIVTFLLNAGLKADKQVTELAKSLGIGKDQANGLRENFVRYSAATEDAFITTNKLLKAQGELTQELGIAGTYTGKQTEDFTRLTELIGLSANEAGKLARLAVVNSTSIEDTTKSIIRGSAAAQRSNNISIDQRTILKDIANLSEGILVKFQGNPEALGRAVFEARKLGTTLETIDKIGESLLNFESSIENQLKAQLLTGKQLNLEQARYAALTGDQITLTKEVASQVGSLADFQNMNVLAQRSLAEAFGLSRDELSKMLIDQEKINKLGDVSKMTLNQQLEALKAQGEPLDSVLYKQIQQQSAQEKFNNTIEKLQDIVGNLVAGPFGKLLNIIADILDNTILLSAAMGIYIGKQAYSLTISAAAFLLAKRTAKMTAVDAAAEAAKSVAKIPYIGGILAIGTGLATFAALSGLLSKGDDVMSEGGYGKRTLLSPEGAIKLNDKDTVIAGTNLGGSAETLSPNINRDSINRTPQPSFDTSAITDAISALSNTVNGLINRPQPTPQFALHVDGKQLGTVVGKQQETGTAQNIYTGYQMA